MPDGCHQETPSRQRFVERNRPASNPVLECFAFDEFEDQRVCLATVFKPVDRRDVRMIERGEQARFALEAGQTVRVAGERLRQNLQCDVAAKLRITCAVDLSHPAGAEGALDLIRPEACANRQ